MTLTRADKKRQRAQAQLIQGGAGSSRLRPRQGRNVIVNSAPTNSPEDQTPNVIDAATAKQILDFLSSSQESWRKQFVDTFTDESSAQNAVLRSQIQELQWENAALKRTLERNTADTAEMSSFQSAEILRVRMIQQNHEARAESEKERQPREIEDLKFTVQMQQDDLDDMKAKCNSEICRADDLRQEQEADSYRLWDENLTLKGELQGLHSKMETYLMPIFVRALIDMTRDKIMDLFPEFRRIPRSSWNDFITFATSNHLGATRDEKMVRAIRSRIHEACSSHHDQLNDGSRLYDSAPGWLNLSDTALRAVIGDALRNAGNIAAHPKDLGLLRDAVRWTQSLTCYHDLQEIYDFLLSEEN